MASDPYSELGVKRDASDAEIQKAFRKLAKELHPDQNKGNKASDERFKRITAAYDFLKDSEKRKRFDRGEIDADGREIYRGFSGNAGTGGFGGAAGGPFGGRAQAGFEGVDLDDIFDMFGGLGGAAGARRTSGFQSGGFGGGAAKGSDLKIKLEIDLLDTIVGNTRRVMLSDGRTLDVNIPKGSRDGQTLRLKGQGGQPPGGRGQPGDVLVELHLKAHPIFRLDGNDLHMDLYVSLPDAILGGKVQAATPDGPVSVSIAKGSNSGAVLRLKGKGAYDARVGKDGAGKDGARGDLFAHIVVALPDKASDIPAGIGDELARLMERWRAEGGYAPNAPNRRK
ncbi:MAG: DnaJ C-terminal domain-containing protein [Asticcacaulis sp.]